MAHKDGGENGRGVFLGRFLPQRRNARSNGEEEMRRSIEQFLIPYS
jgi:hypothetical protein